MTNGRPWPYDNPRPCSGCVHRLRTFGLTYCGLGKWSGVVNESVCDAFVLDAVESDLERMRR